ncbi:MAG: hypothetical protein BWY06_01556 [Candidatus Latescibacteria bacterium ADurb.Bin168]|nr:MAG: hypothetical protein BWY06_01556 [Candidatus Latescibacteria bacterium ADurb.Bin168]
MVFRAATLCILWRHDAHGERAVPLQSPPVPGEAGRVGGGKLCVYARAGIPDGVADGLDDDRLKSAKPTAVHGPAIGEKHRGGRAVGVGRGHRYVAGFHAEPPRCFPPDAAG